jgi:iron complex outermembrane recepter protein
MGKVASLQAIKKRPNEAGDQRAAGLLPLVNAVVGGPLMINRKAIRWMAAMTPLWLQTGLSAAAPADSGEAAGSGSDVLQTIVVTSERRTEDLQEVPAAITAISGDQLQTRGVTDLTQLSLLVPSARFSVETNVVQVFIRGIGTEIDSPFVPEPVATNVNDVYVPRWLTKAALFDLNRIEVLPGPQGTLYGKSALGGVVNISANEPTQELMAAATVEAGNYSLVHFTGVLNTPITDDFAVRVALNTVDHDGYLTNGTDTEHSTAVRVSALYTPADAFSLLLWGSYYINHDRPQSATYVPYPDPGDSWIQPSHDPLPLSKAFYPPDGYDLADTHGRYQSAVLGGRVTWKLDDVVFTYIPSFLSAQSLDNHILEGFPAPDTANIHQSTQELRVAGTPPGPFSYLGGFYWYREESDWTAYLGDYLGGYAVPNVATGYAGYGQGTYAIQNWVRATAGIRYSRDKEDAPDAADIYPAGTPPNYTEGLIPFSARARWDHVDWKVGLEADVTDHSLVYGNVQTGYDPGGYQSVQPTAGTALQEQKMLGYTVGTKNRFLNDHVQLNDELYYYDYKNYVLTAQSGASSLAFNVPRSRIYGDELDAIVGFDEGTQLNASVGLLSAKITQFTVNGISYSGYELPDASQATVSVGAQQSWHLPTGSVKFRVDTHYEDGFWGTFDHARSGVPRQPAFTKTDISVIYYSAGGGWDVGIWGRNLENSSVYGAIAGTGFPPPFAASGYQEPPRTFGVRVHVNVGKHR